MASNDLRL
jgi:transposase